MPKLSNMTPAGIKRRAYQKEWLAKKKAENSVSYHRVIKHRSQKSRRIVEEAQKQQETNLTLQPAMNTKDWLLQIMGVNIITDYIPLKVKDIPVHYQPSRSLTDEHLDVKAREDTLKIKNQFRDKWGIDIPANSDGHADDDKYRASN